MLSCLLVLELLLAAAPAEASREPFQWKVPGLVSVVDVPDTMNVGGIPVRIQVYSSKEKLERLLQYFATAFDDAGFYLQRHQPRLAAEPHLTALDTRTFTSYTVILTPEPGGLTTVVLGQARLGEARPAAPPGFLPVYDGAMNVLYADLEGARTLTYRAPGKEAEVRGWYRDQLTRSGFKEESPQVFRRGEQELRVSLSQEGGWVQVVIFLKTGGEPPPLEPEPETR
ncbi:hypothetical protein [Archangium violaceum]|uniref:Uncharacterized protein n=1 Tax=Archangium violaceum Cb vi76 TaxID=1406225 RepID=A0A084SWM5_9BACT|nr:hypothetical protein [Archangium violaceum]KFA92860.1 hypothetical protein Q664_12680 [Archangium violaceum Cb vi76]